MQYGSKLVPRWRSEIYSYTCIIFRITITNMLLASCNACNIRMWLCQQFFNIGKIITIQILKNKIDELTNVIDFYEFPSLSFVTSFQYVCYVYEENKSGSSVNEIPYRMFTKKKLSEYCLPSILDALVLHLCKALIFFH